MPRPPIIAHAAMVAAAALAACHSSSGPQPDPGPSLPPPAAAAAPPATVTEDDVQDQRVVRAEEMLRGRFPGVEVIALPSGGISVRIRGASSVALSSEPLFVVDGMPVHAEPGGALKWLNPHDVRRIEVLKDPGSTGFYGSRGAAGVILITTKD